MEELIGLIMGAAVMMPLAGSVDGEPEADAPPMQQVYEEASMYMAADTMMVVGANHSAMNTWIEDHLLPFEAGDEGAGSSDGFADDIDAAYMRHLGMNPLNADEIVVGASMQGLTSVFFGDFEAPTVGEELEVAGHTVHRVMLEEVADEEGPAMQQTPQLEAMYMLRVDVPRPAMVMASSENLLEMVLTGEEFSLAGEAASDSIVQMVEAAGNAQVLIAADLLPMQQMMQQPMPDAALLSYGERTLRVHAEGMDDGLLVVESAVDEVVNESMEIVEYWYGERRELDAVSRPLVVAGYHSMVGLQEQLQPQHDGNTVTYELKMNETTPLALASHLGGIGWSVGMHEQAEPVAPTIDETGHEDMEEVEPPVEDAPMEAPAH